jgi:hypothetical protein
MIGTSPSSARRGGCSKLVSSHVRQQWQRLRSCCPCPAQVLAMSSCPASCCVPHRVCLQGRAAVRVHQHSSAGQGLRLLRHPEARTGQTHRPHQRHPHVQGGRALGGGTCSKQWVVAVSQHCRGAAATAAAGGGCSRPTPALKRVVGCAAGVLAVASQAVLHAARPGHQRITASATTLRGSSASMAMQLYP